MRDDTGVALLAHVDAVHLDDALAWVEASDGRYRAWRETETSEREQRESSRATDTALKQVH